jgi:uncharacterized protein with ParB-like and HNH nuclease domain
MRTSATNRRLRILLTGISDGTLRPRPEFQRRLVWTNKDKVNFVDTVLQGYPFPEIYIAAGSVDPNTGVGTEMLVDGQQRITTLFQYFKGAQDLKLPKSFPSYATLTDERKVEFLEYEVVIRDLGNMDIESIKRVFTRINSTNYALNAMEIQNARFAGELKQFAEDLALSQFFTRHQSFSGTEVRRMQDVRYCLSLVITILSTYFNRDSELETYLERYNEDFSLAEDLTKQLQATFDFVESLTLPENSRAWKKVDLFSLVVEVNRALFKRKVKLEVADVRKRLLDFYDAVDRIQGDNPPQEQLTGRYHRAALQATNDRGNRIVRGEIVQSLLDPRYQPQFPEAGRE